MWIPALSAIGAGFAIGLAAIGSGVGQAASSMLDTSTRVLHACPMSHGKLRLDMVLVVSCTGEMGNYTRYFNKEADSA